MLASVSLVLSSAVALASAATYSLSVYAPDHADINGAQVQASGQGFYLGLSAPSSHCPTEIENQAGGCPPVHSTVVDHIMGSLAVGVPGGQQIYVDQETGALVFTAAHSGPVPPGSLVGGWQQKKVVPTCSAPCGAMDWLDPKPQSGLAPTGGVFLCPVEPRSAGTVEGTTVPEGATMQVHVGVYTFSRADCVSVPGLLLTESSDMFGAWQYV